ncbi:hypothetical protein PCL_12334 [Purpureocillium lilacinum]|uniref:Uncharacterized protein n=1 Tax=Purpureocillium lilacinum TaxID=33203 RepID=A0A2U3E8Y3_PURLI|nr:hypothetical protein PCL_12334 [Purpureocillium lilacinum]
MHGASNEGTFWGWLPRPGTHCKTHTVQLVTEQDRQPGTACGDSKPAGSGNSINNEVSLQCWQDRLVVGPQSRASGRPSSGRLGLVSRGGTGGGLPTLLGAIALIAYPGTADESERGLGVKSLQHHSSVCTSRGRPPTTSTSGCSAKTAHVSSGSGRHKGDEQTQSQTAEPPGQNQNQNQDQDQDQGATSDGRPGEQASPQSPDEGCIWGMAVGRGRPSAQGTIKEARQSESSTQGEETSDPDRMTGYREHQARLADVGAMRLPGIASTASGRGGGAHQVVILHPSTSNGLDLLGELTLLDTSLLGKGIMLADVICRTSRREYSLSRQLPSPYLVPALCVVDVWRTCLQGESSRTASSAAALSKAHSPPQCGSNNQLPTAPMQGLIPSVINLVPRAGTESWHVVPFQRRVLRAVFVVSRPKSRRIRSGPWTDLGKGAQVQSDAAAATAGARQVPAIFEHLLHPTRPPPLERNEDEQQCRDRLHSEANSAVAVIAPRCCAANLWERRHRLTALPVLQACGTYGLLVFLGFGPHKSASHRADGSTFTWCTDDVPSRFPRGRTPRNQPPRSAYLGLARRIAPAPGVTAVGGFAETVRARERPARTRGPVLARVVFILPNMPVRSLGGVPGWLRGGRHRAEWDRAGNQSVAAASWRSTAFCHQIEGTGDQLVNAACNGKEASDLRTAT